MANIDAGDVIYDLRKKIQQIRYDLNELEDVPEIPELITSTNALRHNEYLSSVNTKKTDLLDAYVQYSEALEKLLSSVFEIQNDLKDIVKEQSSLITSQTKKTHGKTKPKSIKKQTKSKK